MADKKKFNPNDHMMRMSRRQRQPNGTYRTVNVDYLEVKWRIVWFREDHPRASINTRLLSEPGANPAVVQCTITLEDGVTATGFGQIAEDKWSDYLEKAETRAIGRALGLLGYGTQFAGDDFEDPIADSPVDRQAGPGASPDGSASKESRTTRQKRPGQPGASYTPVESSGDPAQDAVNIMERVEAAGSLTALKPIIENARSLKVLDDSDVSGAIVLKLSDALEKVTGQDQVKAIMAVAEDAGVNGLGAMVDAEKAAVERIKK